ncbi:MAG TPA: MarR family transcriptional regulator [Patescibacteria group bacterium]|nr:MarR family transcriptional regulator [Patescibacteria group bacterium]
MGPTNNIGYLIQRLAFCLGRQSDQVLQDKLGIGLSQFKILMILQWHPSILQKHIAEALGQTEASVSRQIKVLQKQGYLETRVTPENRREHITKLSKSGVRAAERAIEELNTYHSPTFARLSESQLNELHEALTKLYDAACQRDNFRQDLHHQLKGHKLKGGA